MGLLTREERAFLKNPCKFMKSHSEAHVTNIKHRIRKKTFAIVDDLGLIVDSNEKVKRTKYRKHPTLNLGRKGKGVIDDAVLEALHLSMLTLGYNGVGKDPDELRIRLEDMLRRVEHRALKDTKKGSPWIEYKGHMISKKELKNIQEQDA